jgi:hypothetical protein
MIGSLMKKLSKFIKLRTEERLLLLRTVFLVVMIRLGLLFLPFRQLKSLLATKESKTRPRSSPPWDANRVFWSVGVASSLVPGTTCLCRSLAAQRLLAQLGRITTLRIGVAKFEGGIFQAHAWLEDPTGILLKEEKELSSYRPLPALESPRE